jgi:hypothetical protein
MAEPIPALRAAVERLSDKTPVGSVLKSADWQRLPVALRERAQFSAGVQSLRVLQAIQDRLLGQLAQQREATLKGPAIFDRSSFIDEVRAIARDEGLTPVDPAERGTVRDITSIPRLGLIYDTQVGQAAGFTRYQLDLDPGALVLYPAQRLSESTANEPRPRAFWERRWTEAGAATGWEGALQNDFVALKTARIWAALSTFGVPWPPFDFGSTRELEDVAFEEAVALGLITPDWQPPRQAAQDFNDDLQAGITDLDPRSRELLERWFGGQINVTGDTAKWV